MGVTRRGFLGVAAATAVAGRVCAGQRGVVGVSAPDLAKADVLVVGSGPAGVAAASKPETDSRANTAQRVRKKLFFIGI